MKESRRLERYQNGYYNQDEARKSFTLSIGFAGVEVSARPLKIDRSRITLRFMRKGLFSDRVAARFRPEAWQSMLVYGSNFKYEANQEKPLAEKDIDRSWHKDLDGLKLKEFTLAATTLNTGYLYLKEKGSKHGLLEFRVNESGELFPVVWADAKRAKSRYTDKRGSSKKAIREIRVPHDSTFIVAYSRFQWSTKKVEDVLNEEAEAIKGLTEYHCSGYAKMSSGKLMKHAPYDDLVAQFNTQDQRAYGEYLKRTLKRIAVDETYPKSTPLKEDMFLILDDPIGCGKDIEREVKYQTDFLKATVEAIKRGGKVDDLLKKITKGEALKRPKGRDNQISSMVLLAQMIYRVVYSDKKMKDEFAEHLSEKKLKRILGVEERKGLRDRLKESRKDLKRITEWDSFKEELKYDDFVPASQIADLEETNISMVNTFLLSDPYYIDSSLGIPEEENNKPDREGNKSILKDYSGGVDIPTKKFHEHLASGADWAGKIYGLAGKYFEMTSVIIERQIPIETIYRFEENVSVLVTRINKLGFGSGSSEFKIQKVGIRQYLGKVTLEEGIPLDSKFVGSEPTITRTTSQSNISRTTLSSGSTSTTEILQSKRTDTISVIEWKEAESYKQPQAIADSPHWQNFGRVLNILNLGFATNKMLNDPNWKSSASVGSGALDVASDVIKIAEARNALGRKAKTWEVFGKRVGLAGAILGFGLSVHDSYESYENRDYKSAGLQAGAAIAFGASAMLGVGQAAFFLGPFGWAALGIGLAIFSVFTSDSPLETFFKNIAFSNENRFTASNKHWDTATYNRQFHNDRNSLDSSSGNKWADFERALVEFTDMIITPKIEMTVESVVNKTTKTFMTTGGIKDGAGPSVERSSAVGDVSEFNLKIGVGQFLYDKEQLEITPYFFKNGLGASNGFVRISTSVETSFVKGDKDNPNSLEVRFKVPTKIIDEYTENYKSKIVALCYLKLGNGQFYPHSLKGERRYIGVSSFVKVYEAQDGSIVPALKGTDAEGLSTKVDTFDKIMKSKKW